MEEDALRRLVALVAEYHAGRINEATLRERILADSGIRDLAMQQAGTSLKRDGQVIHFGDHSQLGDVQIRDVAGGNIIHLTINIGTQPNQVPPRFRDPDEIAHKRALIAQHKKMLNALEIQAAKFGLYAPPHVTIEIEELQQKIAQLRAEIGEA